MAVKVWPPIVSVPVRAGPLFAVALQLTMPLPVPLAPAVTLSQEGSLLAAVQGQPAPAVTVTEPVAAAEDELLLVGLRATEQPLAWLTVKVWPAAVIVPLRAGPLFAVALQLTEPLPVPDAPDVTVSQDVLLLTAVQAQPALVVRLTEPLPPAAVGEALVGLSV